MRFNSKWVIYSFLPHEYDDLRIYLEEMALKGWKLEKFSGSILKFKKIEPRKIKYSIDIIESISIFDSNNSDSSLEYREYCSAVGWDFLCENNKLQIYCSEKEIPSLEIHTDELEKFNLFKKASLKTILLNLFLIIIVTLPQALIFFDSPNFSFLANDINILLLIIITLTLIVDVATVFNFFRWINKAKKSIKLGEKPSYRGLKGAKQRQGLSKLLVLVTLLGILILTLTGDNIFIVSLMTIFFPIMVMIYLRKEVDKTTFTSKRKRKLNIIAILVVPSILTFLLIFGMIFYIFSNGTFFEENIETVVTLTDLNRDLVGDKSYRSKKGILASTMNYSEFKDEFYLTYEIFESKYRAITEGNIKRMIKYNKKMGNNFTLIEDNSEKKVKVYSDKNKNEFILVSENKVINFSSDFLEVDKNEMIKLFYNKIIA